MSEYEATVDENEVPDPNLNRITNAILGAAIEVHRTLGPGFPESVYGKALEVEFKARHIRFEAQSPVNIVFKGVLVGQGRMDFLVESNVVLEIKTVDAFTPIHTAQTISYLRATGLRLALLINFNVRRLMDGIKRIAH